MKPKAQHPLEIELSKLDQEAEELRAMGKTIDDIQEKLDANEAARKRLRNKLLGLGYRL